MNSNGRVLMPLPGSTYPAGAGAQKARAKVGAYSSNIKEAKNLNKQPSLRGFVTSDELFQAGGADLLVCESGNERPTSKVSSRSVDMIGTRGLSSVQSSGTGLQLKSRGSNSSKEGEKLADNPPMLLSPNDSTQNTYTLEKLLAGSKSADTLWANNGISRTRARPHSTNEKHSSDLTPMGKNANNLEMKLNQIGDDPDFLKMELRKMQNQLIEIMRGKDRGVGGSQFRTNVQYQTRPKTAGECASCEANKAAVRKSKARAQEAVDRAMSLAELLASEQKSHKHTREELERVKRELEEAQANFASRLGHMTSMLQAKEQFSPLNTSRKSSILPQVTTPEQEESNQLKRRVTHLEDRNGTLHAELHRVKNEMDAEKVQKQALEMEHAAIKEELHDAYKKMDGTFSKIEQMQLDSAEALQQHLLEMEKIKAEKVPLQNKIDILTEAIHSSALTSNRTSKNLQDEIDSLKRRVLEAEQQRDIQQEQNTVILQKVKEVEAHLDEEEELHQNTRFEKGELSSKLTNLKQDMASLERDYGACEQKLKDLTESASKEKEELQSKLKELEEKILELNQKLHKEAKMHKQALEAALNSVVRLCVVAPTVNVNMAGNEIQMKAPLPNAKIKTFVEGEILPKFARIFMQQESTSNEPTGPDGVQMDKWLQVLLHEMQTSIESYLSKLFNAQEKRR